MAFIDFLCLYHPPTPREAWLSWIEAGDISIDSFPARAARIVREGERFTHVMRGVTEPDVNASIGILFEDDAVIVVDKPAPLPIHPCGRFNRNTLLSMLENVYGGAKLRIAHRLDANTTGVVLLCRTAKAAGFIQPQFERREVQKLYFARVEGTVPWDEHCCELPIANSAGRKQMRRNVGARCADENGQPARTDFQVAGRLGDGTTLVYAKPVTGRTNQIRVHLWTLGYPIMGDLLYRADGELGDQQTLSIDDPPLCLHAKQLSLVDPTTLRRTAFKSDDPSWWAVPTDTE
ncbi:Ribosomal large subunit pseudouridine synthase A [Planctomycetes bacterium CA13]|uniref:Pseudouridine synthase n=2 Tax=Novipirellula herctigrandis TaxID=2527986 RepID=A0A5C5ZCG0_9BACT|nr:Ribosomal large subunit pseudouridine synthase A [Planctomycetes bacterium CA13]